VQITNGNTATIIVQPGSGGYATISGMQIGWNPIVTASRPVALAIPSRFAPSAITQRATTIRSTSAILNATINPHGSPATAWFEWGATPDLGNSTAAQSLSGVSSNLNVSAEISGLVPGQTYYFRARASNPVGPASGDSMTLRWGPSRPLLASTRVSHGPLALHFSGTAGHAYVVQASADMVHWQVIGSATESSSGSFDFTDSTASQAPARFYRLMAP